MNGKAASGWRRSGLMGEKGRRSERRAGEHQPSASHPASR